MTHATFLLVDNGSSQAASVLNLRRLAKRLSDTVGSTIHAVSLQHAQKIPPQALEGKPADTFVPFMEERLARGERCFIVVPLFFGPSRALSSFIPEQTARLADRFGEFELRIAPVLCPLPEGEPRLAHILCGQLPKVGTAGPKRVILVDHGSPIPEVTAVRHYLAEQMRSILDPDVQLLQAVMERRQGTEYDFNGRLLEEVLTEAGEQDAKTPVALSLLFLSPGRHAGSGGDIETICQRVTAVHPGWRVLHSGLVGEDSGLIPILCDRLDAAR
jgi:sirohydrochlorin ferrochelatase